MFIPSTYTQTYYEISLLSQVVHKLHSHQISIEMPISVSIYTIGFSLYYHITVHILPVKIKRPNLYTYIHISNIET